MNAVNQLINAAQNANQPAQNASKPKAKYWMNIGFMSGESFISLGGFPLDTAAMDGKSKFAATQRKAIQGFITKAAALQPGTDELLPVSETVVLQLRHYDENATADNSDADNAAVANILSLLG